ncbi:DsbA family protein [Micromonospora sp. WMMA1947]|uniref:2-hydroxychromene-2-carboxylate isomerase n=1 Tax=Micromonospora sp. WMMA1947 TaxID=3015163 RepID=UPI00248B994A|nr:DsbA family protein [Micromonospora sp. WMMA1947]WBC07499.1 DsbA family protein [Micromonospora sp. WMMA1947]
MPQQPGTRPRQATFFFSFRSPYSWLTYLDLRDRYADVADAVHWLPFWEPDEWTTRLIADQGGRFDYSPMSRAKHLYILRDIRRLSRERDLEMTWPVDRDPHWEVSHLPFFAAERQGVARRYVDRVYQARWQEGRDISDPATIVAIGDEIGLPGTADVVDDPVVRKEGAAALAAAGRVGAFGVPFFVVDRDAFWGLDRLPLAVAALRGSVPRPADDQVPDEATVGMASGVASTDGGHAGGCG